MMPLNDYQFKQITSRIGHNFAITDRSFLLQVTMLSNEFAIFINGLDLKEVEVIEYNDVGHEAWGNGSAIIETEILGSIIGGQPNSFNSIKAQFDSTANH